MRAHKFGSTDIEIPVIGQGSWQFPNSEEAIAALKLGVDLGMTHIDTAEMYTGAEEVISKALKDISREKIFLASKVLPSNGRKAAVRKACDQSLKRLKVDYLDCYLIHWRGAVPLAETFSAMKELVQEGKIRSIGVSNFDQNDLLESIEILGEGEIACNQVLYNIYQRGIDRGLIEFCAERKIAVVAYTPFGRKAIPSSESAEGRVLAQVALSHNASIAQIMLAFLTRLENLFTIPKASSLQHTNENAGAGRIILSEQEIREIDLAFPIPKTDGPLAML